MKYFASKLSDNLNETPEGFLLCLSVSIARTGDQEYLEAETPLKAKNGKVTIYRSPEEVFSEKTIASFEGKCLTIEHPAEFVTAESFKELSVGHIQNVRRGEGDQENDLVADVLIKDADAILLVKEGLRGLSCGYEAEYVQLEDGKGEQKAIRGNHLAVVEEGRAGPNYAIKDEKGNSFMKSLKESLDSLTQAFNKMSKVFDKKTTDEDPEKKEGESKDAEMIDALIQACGDLMKKIEGMKPAKDADPEEKEAPAKDGDVESRLAALEEKLSKLLEAESSDEDESEVLNDEDPEEETGDESEEESEDAKEDDKDDKKKTGDIKSRAEILAPGIAFTKDVKIKALEAAYKTADGKKAIDSVSGGKPNFKDEKLVDVYFRSASELLKHSRNKDTGEHLKNRSKDAFQSTLFKDDKVMTPEKINKMNQERYNRQ